MKVKGSAIIMLSALSLGLMQAHAASVTTNGGAVHFRGEVVNAACAVDAQSIDQTVQLGQVRTAKLTKDGETSNAVGFHIQLNGCDNTTVKKAAISFYGTPINSAHKDILGLQGSAGGAATNVGVQILDASGNAVPVDGSAIAGQLELSEGTNIFPFQARYYATGVATAGNANADVNFRVQYD